MLNRAELERHYQRLELPLYNFALRWTWNRELAQELVQDAFIRVWQARARVEEAMLKPFLYRVVQNLAISERRRRKVREALPILEEWFGEASRADEEFLRREQLVEVRAALESLPEELRRTILLCEFSDLTQPEIGKIIGIPAGTVASRRNRALALLREKLTQEMSANEMANEMERRAKDV